MLNGLEKQKDCLVTSIRYLINISFATKIDVNWLPVEIWCLIVKYLPVIGILNLSLCSKFCYVICHKDELLDKKMAISKYLVSFNKFCYIQINRLFRSHFNNFFECYQKNFNTYTFACLGAKLKEIVYDVLPLRIYCHLFLLLLRI